VDGAVLLVSELFGNSLAGNPLLLTILAIIGKRRDRPANAMPSMRTPRPSSSSNGVLGERAVVNVAGVQPWQMPGKPLLELRELTARR
jgi:hypothetical protein